MLNTTKDSSTLKNMWKHFLSVNSWHSKKFESEGILLFWGTLSWVFIERTDVEGETAVLWPPDAKS